jgi:hypothetical protein
MILEEHFECPECGYDLYGIPDLRCPECGFRYDASALRSMATTVERVRWVAARGVIVRSTIGASLCIPTICYRLPINPVVVLLIMAVVSIAVAWIWVRFTDYQRSVAAVPNYAAVFGIIALTLGVLATCFNVVALVVGELLVAWAWLIRCFHWPALSPPADHGSARIQLTIERDSGRANLYLGLASVFAVLALVL